MDIRIILTLYVKLIFNRRRLYELTLARPFLGDVDDPINIKCQRELVDLI